MCLRPNLGHRFFRWLEGMDVVKLKMFVGLFIFGMTLKCPGLILIRMYILLIYKHYHSLDGHTQDSYRLINFKYYDAL